MFKLPLSALESFFFTCPKWDNRLSSQPTRGLADSLAPRNLSVSWPSVPVALWTTIHNSYSRDLSKQYISYLFTRASKLHKVSRSSPRPLFPTSTQPAEGEFPLLQCSSPLLTSFLHSQEIFPLSNMIFPIQRLVINLSFINVIFPI